MSFQRGQAPNHAPTDAGQLRDALVEMRAGADCEAAVTAFEDAVIRHGGGEVRDGSRNTVLLHDWEKIKQSPLYMQGMRRNE